MLLTYGSFSLSLLFLNTVLCCVAQTCKTNAGNNEKSFGIFRTNAALTAAVPLTLSLGDGAADGGAGGGDGAHGGAHAIRRVHPGHGRRVGHPGSGVNGSDGFACRIGDNVCHEHWLFLQKILLGICIGIQDNRREVLTPRQSKAAAWIGVPTLGHSQCNGAGNRHNQRERKKFNGTEIFSCNQLCSHRNLLSLS